jgi:acyl-CoA dehydrogenase
MALSSDEFERFLAGIRAFTRDRLIPAERQVEAEDRVPEDIVAGMRQHGLFGLTIPPAYGGLGLGMEQQVRATIEFTQASSVFRARFSTTLGLGSQAILHNATEAQKRRTLPRLASGEWTAAFALTEPEAGSDAGNVQTAARRDGTDYVLNGRKRYITNAPEADLFVVMARTDPRSTDHRGVSAFLLEAGAPGLTVRPPDRKLGQHGSHISEMIFEDCRVPAENLIGDTEGIGFKCAMDGINVARMHVAATCVGQAMRLIDEALTYALQRRQFGKPIAEFQAIQIMLADSRAEMLAARAMTLETARRIDLGERPLGDMSCCKYFASEMACRVADRAVQILGGAGYVTAHAVERLYRDVRLFRIFEGTSQIHQLIIAREMMKQAGAAAG